jgi:DNA polymerase-3 subunit alpha
MRAADLGMDAMALTEHGNVSSHVPLEKYGLQYGIKTIFGLEGYTAPSNMRDMGNRSKWHLTLLASDQEGYRNLMRLTTRSWAEGFYQWPTISGEMLAEHNEGLIVLSGCSDSHLACTLLGGKGRDKGSEHDANRLIQQYKDLLGDRYYLEVQAFPELQRTHAINGWYAAAARRHGIPLVATSDVHYPFAADNEMQVILHTASRGGSTVEATAAEWEYDIPLTLPTSDAFITKRLLGTGLSRRDVEGSIATTRQISDRCIVTLPKADRLKFPLPSGYSSAEELIWDWLRRGWEYRSIGNRELRRQESKYLARMRYEMDLILQKDYVDYMLMLSEAVVWAKDRGIAVGPARGSAAASLVVYLLRITEIDPLPFPNMLFERFIDLNRTDLPDIDLDFDDERREELTEHMVEMYGADHVGNVGTFTKYRGKNSLGDVARVNGIDHIAILPVKALIVERSGGDSRADSSLQDTIDLFPQAKAVFDEFPVLYKSFRLEGNYKGMQTHASGLVISNDPLTDNVATYTRETGTGKHKKIRQVLSVDKHDAEYLNLLKADFLGLSTMGMIGRCLRMIGMSLDDLYLECSTLDDPRVIESFRNNDVTGIFQFGGGATRVVNNDVKPDNFLELCDINALSRPGPLHSGTTNDYIAVKWGRKEPDFFHERINEITVHTKHQIIYQEQILQIIKELGGLGWAHIQEIRKIISLKKGEGAFNERKQDFIDGCMETNGINEELAVAIWNRLVTAGQYAFNASHCVSYSMLAYWCMWFKVYHPLAFYSNQLVKDSDNQYWLLRDAIKHGIKILPPNVNRSDVEWTPTGPKTIRGGFAQVPGIGQALGEVIVNDRRAMGPFDGWGDLIRVKGIGSSKMTMIREMAESDDPFNIYVVDQALAEIRAGLKRGDFGPRPYPTVRASEIPTDATRNLPLVWIGVPQSRNPQDIVEDERARTGMEMEEIEKTMKRPDLRKKMAVVAVDDSDETVYLRFSRWTFPKFEKALWNLELGKDVVLVKGKRLSMVMGRNVQVEQMWIFKAEEA